MRNNFNKYDEGRKIGSVTRIPSFLLTWIGRFDSRKSERSIPDAKVREMKSKCASLERGETLLTEKRCEKLRDEGKKAIGVLYSEKKELNAINDGDNTPYAIRQTSKSRSGCQIALMRLLEIHEALIHADTVLVERIRRTREKAFETKIAAYIKGVRKGKLPDYEPDLELSDNAYEVYCLKHQFTDEAIAKAAENIMKEASIYETV